MIYSNRFIIIENKELNGWDIAYRKIKQGNKVIATFYSYDMALQYLLDLEVKPILNNF